MSQLASVDLLLSFWRLGCPWSRCQSVTESLGWDLIGLFVVGGRIVAGGKTLISAKGLCRLTELRGRLGFDSYAGY